MILISFIHVTGTERNISKAVTINTQFTIAAVTLELRTVQQLQEQQLYTTILRPLRIIPAMERNLFPTDYF